MKLKSQGIGAIAVTGKPLGAKITLEFFDAVLALPPIVVAVKDLFGCSRAIGNDITEVGAQRTHFDFDHNPASFFPASGPMAKTMEDPHGVTIAGILTLRPFKPALGSSLKYRVGGNPDGIEDLERLQRGIDLWSGRAGIGPIADLTLSKASLKPGNQPPKLNGDCL